MENQVITEKVKRFGMFAAISGFIAVALGAFGSHGLKGVVTASDLSVWKTAVQYQMFHTLALLIVVLYLHFYKQVWLERAAIFLAVGIILFSGSLYVLVLTDLRWLGAITPLGGVVCLCGWFAIFMALRAQLASK
jgi:uncharacterized membrane protein YgdD (TMEM256/DUF423 family)